MLDNIWKKSRKVYTFKTYLLQNQQNISEKQLTSSIEDWHPQYKDLCKGEKKKKKKKQRFKKKKKGKLNQEKYGKKPKNEKSKTKNSMKDLLEVLNPPYISFSPLRKSVYAYLIGLC